MSGIVRPPLEPHMAILKPCPFCGSKWTQVRWIGFEDSLNSGYASGYRGECTDCGAMTLAAFTVEAAAEAWNRRASDVRSVKEGENITENNPVDEFVCSECGIILEDWSRVEIDEDDGERTNHEYVFRFCPNCGTKVRGTDG